MFSTMYCLAQGPAEKSSSVNPVLVEALRDYIDDIDAHLARRDCSDGVGGNTARPWQASLHDTRPGPVGDVVAESPFAVAT